ncbi:hypothetical protein ACFYUK_28855 [Nonomuraea wenchangensis]
MERGRGLRREYPELAGELGRFLRRHPYEDLEALVAYLRAADAEGLRELVDRSRQEPGADPRRVREVIDHGERALRLDAYVAVLAEDLRSTARFLAVATVLRDHGRAADAEEWARRGPATEPVDPVAAAKLRDLLVGLLLERGAADEAVAVRRAAFEHVPDPDRYAKLRETAEQAEVWAALRPGALDRLRAKGRVSYVVTVLTAEGSHEEAWQTALAAAPGEVPGEQWLTLIARREHERPADVVGPYRWLIDDCLADREQIRYNQVAELLIRLRAVQQGLDDEAGFAAYLGELRERHERRPALIARLADL